MRQFIHEVKHKIVSNMFENLFLRCKFEAKYIFDIIQCGRKCSYHSDVHVTSIENVNLHVISKILYNATYLKHQNQSFLSG
jgi:hypothetical protein